jgi:hypothetical protein
VNPRVRNRPRSAGATDLVLSRETVAELDERSAAQVEGGAAIRYRQEPLTWETGCEGSRGGVRVAP